MSSICFETIRVVTLKMVVSVVTIVHVLRSNWNIQLGKGFNDVRKGKMLIAVANWVADDRWRVEICYDPVHTVFHLLMEIHLIRFWFFSKSLKGSNWLKFFQDFQLVQQLFLICRLISLKLYFLRKLITVVKSNDSDWLKIKWFDFNKFIRLTFEKQT